MLIFQFFFGDTFPHETCLGQGCVVMRTWSPTTSLGMICAEDGFNLHHAGEEWFKQSKSYPPSPFLWVVWTINHGIQWDSWWLSCPEILGHWSVGSRFGNILQISEVWGPGIVKHWIWSDHFTLWSTSTTMENHHFWWEHSRFQWPFSIGMLDYQRVHDSLHWDQRWTPWHPGWTPMCCVRRVSTI